MNNLKTYAGWSREDLISELNYYQARNLCAEEQQGFRQRRRVTQYE
jgi:hypothetical protein